MEHLRYRPSRLWRLDSLTDFSGYGVTATRSMAEVKGLPLVAPAAHSQILISTRYLTLPSNIYQQGKESYDFTMIATIFVRGAASLQQVVSTENQYDGITVNGTVVSFSTAYTGQGSATCSYDIVRQRRVDVVGVHTKDKNSLYINGELVSEVDITPAQQAASYAYAGTNLSSGLTTGAQNLTINMIGLYPHALQPEEIMNIHLANTRVSEADVPKMYGGESFFVSSEVRQPYVDTGWYDDEDWDSGQHLKTYAEDDTLYASKIDGLTEAGIWDDSFSIFDGDVAVPVNSFNFDWDGENVTVEASVDSVTWSTVTRRTNVTLIGANVTPTSDSIFVRVRFTAGATNAYIKNLRVHAYTGTTVLSDNRTITYPNQSIPLYERQPIEMDLAWGVNLNNNQITISSDVTSQVPMTVKTVEIWYRRTGVVTFSANLNAADTTYVNGVATTTTRTEEWIIQHFTSAAGFTGDFTISGATRVGKVAFYPTVLTLNDTLAIQKSYLGVGKIDGGSGGTMSFAEPPSSASAYGHDWEIKSA